MENLPFLAILLAAVPLAWAVWGDPLRPALIALALGLFVGAVQAFIFTILTVVYIQLAVAGHGDGHDEEGEHEDGRLVAEANHLS